MQLDWERHFGFGITSVSVTISKVICTSGFNRHDRLESAVDEAAFEVLCIGGDENAGKFRLCNLSLRL